MSEHNSYYNLGGTFRQTSSGSEEARTWFGRGLTWCYGFHHEEALRCFERGITADARSVMNHWGVAYAAGPNYNKGWDFFSEVERRDALQRIHRALDDAESCSGQASPDEAALVQALAARYPRDSSDDTSAWDLAYADAMRGAYQQFPTDLDIAALFAEALMNCTPWGLWNLRSGEPATGAHTVEARNVLETALGLPGAMAHPGLLHLYIHLMEMSPTPEVALKAADQLRDLVPDAGHLKHMPTHIDVLCGHYDRVVSSNTVAIEADRKALLRDGPLNFYSLYRCHNYHFKLYGAMFMGNSAAALAAAEEMTALLSPELLAVTAPPMADWLEGFVPMRLHVLIRFGLWEQVLDTDFPADRMLYCTTTAMLHYARCIAFAVTDQLSGARKEALLFDATAALVPDTRYVFNNTCIDILAIAREMMLGELQYREGHFEQGFAHLRRAIELDDTLPYDEPWGWMQPTRHALGALLLEQDRVDEALLVYRADLGFDPTLSRACQHPENVWSLAGYFECLERLNRMEEAAIIGQRLTIARARADVPVKCSCFCRRGAAG